MPLVVVVVEDTPPTRELIAGLLGRRGYQVECYGTYAAGWSRLLRGPPHLLVLDLGLPDGDGLDLLRRARALHGPQAYPVLITSGRDSEVEILEGYQAGATDYVTKPFTPQELLAKCAVLISRSRGGAATELLEDERERPLLDRFKAEALLGRGAFGVVYRALDTSTGREVALKLCGQDYHHDLEQRLRFLREAYVLAGLDHPHIVHVVDFGLQDDQLYLAMEYVAGPTLADHVAARGPLGEPEVLDLLRALARALATLHDAALTHRDLKPANVILRSGQADQAVLVDFGLAKRIGERSVTAKSTIVGTPGYLAPEIFLGAAADGRSDLFSLGCTLYYALVGRELFPNLHGVPLMLRMAQGNYPRAPVEDPELAFALRGLLEVDPARRVSSGHALLARLGRAEVRAC